MKKIKREIISKAFLIVSMLSLNEVYAVTKEPSTRAEKIGFSVYLGISILILALLCTYFHLRITRVKVLEDREKKLIRNFNKKIRVIRWIFIAILYFVFIVNLFNIMIIVMYCLEGLGKSMTDIVIYSPMSMATQHFIEMILISGFIIMFSKIEHYIIRNKINKSNEYSKEEKDVLIKYYK